MTTININGLTLCHKGSDGISTATLPDVCKTPSPGGPVPVPYSNVARSSDLAKGTTTVQADGGNMCANYGSEAQNAVLTPAVRANPLACDWPTMPLAWTAMVNVLAS